jgi:hypothetical protein
VVSQVPSGYVSADDRTFIESDFSTWEDEEDDVFAAKENHLAPIEALTNLSLSS